jgi:alkanesulfonate monooxygenase SsuD/methylene tetrahydromethanopterin reductase-like flavin-dependent oxidoreductase (luciferase family)
VIERGQTGDLGLYEGEYARVDLRGARLGGPRLRPSIPIHLPALFEGSIRLAAEIGDGLLGHPIWSLRWIEAELARNLESGLAKAGRSRRSFEVNLWTYVTVDPDRRRAFEDARSTVAFYASRAQYARYYDAHGYAAEARAAVAALARGDFPGAVASIPDEMVTTFSTVGTPDEVREQVERLAAHADSVTLVPPGIGGTLPPERIEAYREAIIRTFFSASL